MATMLLLLALGVVLTRRDWVASRIATLYDRQLFLWDAFLDELQPWRGGRAKQ